MFGFFPPVSSHDLKHNAYGLFTLSSAKREFSKINQKNSFQENAIHFIFCALKCYPLIGNITYLAQKVVCWINNEDDSTFETLFADQISVIMKAIEEKMYQEETPVGQIFISQIEKALETLDEVEQKELIRQTIIALNREAPDFILGALLDELYKKYPSAFTNSIKNSQDALCCAKRSKWLVWSSKNVPDFIGECLQYHPKPLEVIFVSDPTEEKAIVWNYVKNNKNLFEKIIKGNSYQCGWKLIVSILAKVFPSLSKPQGDSEPISLDMRPGKLSLTILEDLFSSNDEIFNSVMAVIKKKSLLEVLIEEMPDRNWAKAIEFIAKRYPERFTSLVKNNFDAFYTTHRLGSGGFVNSCYKDICHFAKAGGNEVAKLIKDVYADDLKKWTEQLREWIKCHGNPQALINLYKIDPELFRATSLEWAGDKYKEEDRVNIAVFARFQGGLYCEDLESQFSWLSKKEPRLFIQLIGMAKNLDKPRMDENKDHQLHDPSFADQDFKTITLDPTDLPTADELDAFYSQLDNYSSIAKPVLEIPLNASNVDKEVIQLLATFFKKRKDPLIKIAFISPIFDLTRPLTTKETFRETFKTKDGTIEIHRTILEQFGIDPKELEQYTNEQAKTIQDFIYKGECALDHAEQMSFLLEKYTPITYLNESDYDNLSEEQRKQFGKIIIKDDVIQESLFIHKVILARDYVKGLTHLIVSNGMLEEDYIFDYEKYGVGKSVIPRILSSLYQQPIEYDQLKDQEIIDLITISDLWDLKNHKLHFSRLYGERLTPEKIKEMDVQERKDLIEWINSSRRSIWLYEQLSLLDDLDPQQRIELIDEIFDVKLAPRNKKMPLLDLDHFNNIDMICRYAKNMITQMNLEEQLHLLKRLMKADLFGAFEEVLRYVKSPFSILFKVGKNCEGMDWYFKQGKFESLYSLFASENEDSELNKRKKLYTALEDRIIEKGTLDKAMINFNTPNAIGILQRPQYFRGILTQLIIDLDCQEAQDLLRALEYKEVFKELWSLNFGYSSSYKSLDSWPDFEYLLSYLTPKKFKQVSEFNFRLADYIEEFGKNGPKSMKRMINQAIGSY